LADASHPRSPQQPFRIASPERFCSHPVLSATIKKRESIVPETIKKRLESYLGWSDLVRRRKKNATKIDTGSDHVAKFRGDRPRELGDLAAKKKEKTSRAK